MIWRKDQDSSGCNFVKRRLDLVCNKFFEKAKSFLSFLMVINRVATELANFWYCIPFMTTSIQGFPSGVDFCVGGESGENWTKWPKTAWKLQNQHFWGKAVRGYGNGGGGGVQANLLGRRGTPSVNPASENPVVRVNIF